MLVAKSFTVDENGPYLLVKGGSTTDQRTLMIREQSATIYIGGPTVDATDGIPVKADEVFSLELFSGDDVYVHAAAEATFNFLVTRADLSQIGDGVEA